MNLSNLKTVRVNNHNIGNVIGYSPNCGLLGYLVDTYSRLDWISREDISETLALFKNEAQVMDGFHFWGWEKTPSIRGVRFPLDWDDTSKVYECIFQLHKDHDINFNLASEEYLQLLFDKSIFESELLFFSDIKVNAKHKLALDVFFGKDQTLLKTQRDDIMVTITFIRMVGNHYPQFIENNRNLLYELLLRIKEVVEYHIHESIYFAEISRYYFSFGHFLFRFSEVIQVLGLPEEKKYMFESFVLDTLDRIQNLKIYTRFDYLWFEILKTGYGFESNIYDIKREIDLVDDELVYQHRRLNHQYFLKTWNRMILEAEYAYINETKTVSELQ